MAILDVSRRGGRMRGNMKQTVVFSDIRSENAYRTAVAFSEMPEYVVYVLHKEGEGQTGNTNLNVIELEARRQDKLAEAMKRIEEERGSIDMLVLAAGTHCEQDGRIAAGHNYEALLEVVDENVIGAVEVVRAAIELMRKGTGKRIAVLTEKASSINLNKDVQDYGYNMSLAALNMLEHLLFNQLRPEGFTFRCYACGDGSGISAEDYLTMKLCYDKDDAYIHSEENRIVMRDAMLCELPW